MCACSAPHRSFCECNRCQRHVSSIHVGPSPELNDNDVVVTHLPPGVESNQSLCLWHWTYIRMDTSAPTGTQSWYERDVGEDATISTSGQVRIADSLVMGAYCADRGCAAPLVRFVLLMRFLWAFGSTLAYGHLPSLHTSPMD